MSDHWFKPRKTLMDLGRPANWKGWAVVVVFAFLLIFLAQSIGAWIFNGFAPLVNGVWLFAMLFVLFGAFLRICNQFTPQGDDV